MGLSRPRRTARGVILRAAAAALSLAVLAVFNHLACQARWNLTRVISESAARKASYSFMVLGGAVTVVISLAACGVHLVK